jgi:PAS domain S-box-containing protein
MKDESKTKRQLINELHELRRQMADFKSTEETFAQMKESHENFMKFFLQTSIPTGLTTLKEGRFVEVNEAFLKLMGLKRDEVIGKTSLGIGFITEENRSILFNELHKKGRVENLELQVNTKGGALCHGLFNAAMMTFNNEKYLLTVMIDITDRKQAEEKIQSSLREKTTFLNEIHHRVKNNLQVICSLLDLQAMSSGNPDVIQMSEECQRRIRAMAKIHETLYQSKDFSRIDLGSYVRDLSIELCQSYKIKPGKIDLTIQTDKAVFLTIGKAIPCALILSELFSNTFKHAFPGEGKGRIMVMISQSATKKIEIIIRDSGVGLPGDVNIHQPRTVGLHLVNGLVKNQLHGHMEVRSDNGTEFRITFH